MHFGGTYSFQYFFPGLFIFHAFQGCRIPFLLVIIQLWHVLWPEVIAERANLLLQFPEGAFYLEPITVKTNNRQRIQFQAGACQDALDAIHFHQYKTQFRYSFFTPRIRRPSFGCFTPSPTRTWQFPSL